jgi:chromosome segregation ATPase
MTGWKVLRARLFGGRAELAELRDQVVRLTQERDRNITVIARKTAENARLRADLVATNEECIRMRRQIDQLKASIEEDHVEMVRLASRAERAEAERAEATDE